MESRRNTLTPLLCCVMLAGCAGPSVNLSTDEPIKVDINVRLDVYQHEAEGKAKPAATPAAPAASDPVMSRQNRAAEVQNFKNSRLVGEGKDGLLVIMEEPTGEYGDYLRKTVVAENADRMKIMEELAESRKRPLTEVQSEQGGIWRARSFSGEWVEVPQADGSFKWEQKKG